MPDTGYQIHTVGPGDTIQAIGDTYGVNWVDIVTVNGLAYPYIDTEPESGDHHVAEGAAVIGRTLLIPTGSLMFPVRSRGDVLDVEKYALGSDLDIYGYVESDAKVIPVGEDGEVDDDLHGDLYLAEGMRNLRQQLVTRLGTPKGTLLLHPEYGSDLLSFIGKKMTREHLIAVKLCVQECILTDARVKAISGLSVWTERTSLFIDLIVHAIDPFGEFRLKAKFSDSGRALIEP